MALGSMFFSIIWGRKITGNMGAKIYKKHGGENLGAKFQKLFLCNTLFRPFLIGRKFRHFALFSVNFLITESVPVCSLGVGQRGELGHVPGLLQLHHGDDHDPGGVRCLRHTQH